MKMWMDQKQQLLEQCSVKERVRQFREAFSVVPATAELFPGDLITFSRPSHGTYHDGIKYDDKPPFLWTSHISPFEQIRRIEEAEALLVVAVMTRPAQLDIACVLTKTGPGWIRLHDPALKKLNIVKRVKP